jgi:hypothetical protein
VTGSTARGFLLDFPRAASESEFLTALEPLAGVPALQEHYAAISQTTTPTPAIGLTRSTVVPIHGLKDRVKVRFRLLKRLGPNHDGEGAQAPNAKTVDAAIAFIDRMTKYKPFFATVDDDGSAVIEFEDRAVAFFADITFLSDGRIECYRRVAGKHSLTFTGDLNASDTLDFLESELQIEF